MLEGVETNALLYTGSEVSCIYYSLSEKNLPNIKIQYIGDIMNMVMTYRKCLLFVGFVELSVETGGICLEKVGFLVIRNSTAGGVILGSNIFRHMANLYNETDLEGNIIWVPIGNITIKSNKQLLVPALSRKIYYCEVSRDIGSIYI